MFEVIKNYSKKNHFSWLILTFENNIKKNSVTKGKCNNQNFPKKIIVDNIAITDETQMPRILMSFLQKLAQNLLKKLKHLQ